MTKALLVLAIALMLGIGLAPAGAAGPTPPGVQRDARLMDCSWDQGDRLTWIGDGVACHARGRDYLVLRFEHPVRQIQRIRERCAINGWIARRRHVLILRAGQYDTTPRSMAAFAADRIDGHLVKIGC